MLVRTVTGDGDLMCCSTRARSEACLCNSFQHSSTQGGNTVHSTQYTSTQYTHSTQYTVHSTHCTVHSTQQYTVHSTQCTVHSTQVHKYAVHALSTQYIVHALSTVHSTQYAVHPLSTQYTAHSAQSTAHRRGREPGTRLEPKTLQSTLVHDEYRRCPV